MDGVTILNTYQTYTLGWTVILVTAIVAAGFCFAISFAFFDSSTIISGISGGLCVVLIIAAFHIPKTITGYEIIVDHSVSWEELTEHYQIINVRGRILKVEEKEQKDEEM